MVRSLWLHGHGQYAVYGDLMATDLCFLPAIELTRLLRNKDTCAREVMSAHLAQIEGMNPKINEIVAMVSRASRPELGC